MSNQNGPTLTLAATCAGCEHLVRHPSGDGGNCTNDLREEWRDWIADGTPTPSWCPLLPAARLAFARAVVKEGEA